MSDLVVGKVVPIGTVLDRPTGELALLWKLYAGSLDRERQLRDKLRKGKAKSS